jgi:addiction module HigA family antidote
MKGVKRTEFAPDYAQPPGAYLEEILDQRGMRKADFATRCGRPAKTISEIIAGKTAILPDTALQFERVLGDVKASLWLTWEADYQLFAARERERQGLQRGKEWAHRFPISEMLSKGYITAKKETVDLVVELLNFFGVSSVAAWEEYWEGRVAAARFKRSGKSQIDRYAVAAWLRRGDVAASELDCEPYNEARFKAALVGMRKLTRQPWPRFREELVRTLANVGVAVAFVPDLHNLNLRGAAYWASKGKAVIIVSDRMKLENRFWFALYHEAMHILLHSKKALFIDYGGAPDHQPAEEKEADDTAANTLISADELSAFLKRYGKIPNSYSYGALTNYADEIGIGASLLLVRLQHNGLISWGSQLNKKFLGRVEF